MDMWMRQRSEDLMGVVSLLVHFGIGGKERSENNTSQVVEELIWVRNRGLGIYTWG